MKKIIMSLVLLALLAGCLGQAGTAQPTKAEVGKALGNVTAAPVKELISVSGSDNLSVVSISAVNQNGSWLFPMKDYEGQFQSTGLYSTAFIQLNGSQISWLDSGENIWLTPMVRNGTGVLFNAIYSNDAVNCSTGYARILGRDYALSGLRNGSSFLMDDKWRVAVDSQGGCPSRIVIYMDGYFDKMKDGEQIGLFRNDNTILLSFEGLASLPSLRVIATRPTEMNTTTKTENGTQITNPIGQGTVTQTLVRNYSRDYPGQQHVVDTTQNGKIITETTSFDEPLRVVTDTDRSWEGIGTNEAGVLMSEVNLTVLGQEYVLPDFNDTSIMLAKESATAVLHMGENISVDGLAFRLYDLELRDGYSAAISISDASGNIVAKDNLSIGETKAYALAGKKYYLHVYQIAPGYAIGTSWADVAVFSEMTYLEDGGIFSTPSNDSYSFNMNRTEGTLQGWQFNKVSGATTAAPPDNIMNVSPASRGIITKTLVHGYSESYPDYVLPGQQWTVDTTQGGKIIKETTSFDNTLQTFTLDGGQGVSAYGYFVPKCQVTVLGNEDYLLLSFNDSGIVLAKESRVGILYDEHTVTVDNVTFRLDGVESHDGVLSTVISILDTNGNVLEKDELLTGETKTYHLAGRGYPFHVYHIDDARESLGQESGCGVLGLGTACVDVTIFSEMAYVEDGGTFTTSSNQSYSFSMNRTGDTLQGWQFRALQ